MTTAAPVPAGTCVRRAALGPARAAPWRCESGCPAYPFKCHRTMAEIEGQGLRLVPPPAGDAPP